MAEPTDTPGASAAPAAPQRKWQAPCPGCGAVVEFASRAAPVAVCSYCRSTVVREGDALRKIGTSAELITDRSPLSLGTSGNYQGRAFTLIGRLQYGYGPKVKTSSDPKDINGTWNEWYAMFDDGRGGWLSEDNDAYVFSFDIESPAYRPPRNQIAPGSSLAIATEHWRVASIQTVRLLAASGELPAPPPLGKAYDVADLRNATNKVATLDYADKDKPTLSIGKSVRLAALGLKFPGGAPEASVDESAARAFNCPNCGASITVNLAGTLSVACPSCRALVDISKGIGAELTSVQQAGFVQPRLKLGSTGRLAVEPSMIIPWTVVGFAQKEGNFDDPDPDERFSWGEYLLYNKNEGFAFLTDTVDGWVVFRTLTGAPDTDASASAVAWNGNMYRLVERYDARVRYVAGEYYWKVDKGQVLSCSDYEGTRAVTTERLSREEGGDEVIWSVGRVIPASVIASAFKVPLPPDASAISAFGGGDDGGDGGDNVTPGQIVMVIAVVIFMIIVGAFDDDDDDVVCTPAVPAVYNAQGQMVTPARPEECRTTSGRSYHK